jgi:superfamily I DNA/RNA helicase
MKVACGRDGAGEKELRRTVNSPFRYISKKFIDDCGAEASGAGQSMLDVMVSNQGDLSPMPRSAFNEWVGLLAELNSIAVRSEELAKQKMAIERPGTAESATDDGVDRRYVGPAAMLSTMLRQTDYIENLRREEGLGEEGGRVAILAELQRMAEQFISPCEFLDYIAELKAAVADGASQLGRGEEDAREALTLSTIHRAKGLEWTNVRLIDLSASRFPHQYAKDQDEELRLLYVAVTRAKRELVVTAHEGHGKEAPSAFIGIMSNTLRTITGT